MNPTSAMRVLVADDEADVREMLGKLLGSWSYEVVVASNGEDAWAILNSPNPPKLAIFDWNMPSVDGLQLTRRIRTRVSRTYTYIIMLTARSDRQDLEAAMEAGADDFMRKPLEAQDLRLRLRVGSRIIALQHELVKSQEELVEQIMYDSLTGVLNRRAAIDIAERDFARIKRTGDPVAMLVLRLDDFRSVNEKFGYDMGDEVLRQTGLRLKHSIRAYDTVGRIGGDEFVVILPGCSSGNVMVAVDRLRSCISAEEFRVGKHLISQTCSIGVAVCSETSRETRSILPLLAEAEKAIVTAMRSGANSIEVVPGPVC